jgi:hypothetical protein
VSETKVVQQEIDFAINDKELTRVRISEFHAAKTLAFDLFLRIDENNYLQIFRAGEVFSDGDLKNYEIERGVHHVYFPRKNRPAYIAHSLSLLQKITPVASIPIATKFNVAKTISELYVEELLQAEEEDLPKVVAQCKEISSTLAAWMDTQEGLDQFVLKQDQIDSTTPSIDFYTGIFSVLLSNQMPWKSRRTSETLLMASLFCDLGHSILSPEVRRMKFKRMSVAQKKEYKKHPEASYLILSDSPPQSLHENVLTMIREHHEYSDGSGYPHGSTSEKTLLLSRVLVLCGDLVQSSIDLLLPPVDAAKELFPEFSEKLLTEQPELIAKYDRSLLLALFKIFRGVSA